MNKNKNPKVFALLKYLNLKPADASKIKLKLDGVLASAVLSENIREGFWIFAASEFEEYGVSEDDRPTYIIIDGKTFAVFPRPEYLLN